MADTPAPEVMKERPILFSAPMVRALLDGTKTQTRRILKRQPELPRAIYGSEGADATITPHLHRCEKGMGVAWRFEMSQIEGGNGRHFEAHFIDHEPVRIVCPYGNPGGSLWVRETWQFHDWTEDGEPIIGYAADNDTWLPMAAPDLSDTWAALSDPANYAIRGRACDQRWRPSIHMPRWASRIDLEITAVRVERLQDISEADAKAEGITPHEVRQMWLYGATPDQRADTYRRAAVAPYRELWEQINGAGSWDANPWVWVVEFRRIKP